MTGRISIREGALADEAGVVGLAPEATDGADEASIREAFRAALEVASGQGAGRVAAPVRAAGALPLQRRAELLFEEARRHMGGATAIEEIRFLVEGEPAYRVFESVSDAARIAEQMERLRRG